ncbi:hypothetical protein WKK05_14540 [Nostoc sp. UHCC 0302]|uniref:hypothetical protein n=1 Tax=Nostoc sp. UHCC 0302 TaxID=3134896 RepID=UPI00311CE08B
MQSIDQTSPIQPTRTLTSRPTADHSLVSDSQAFIQLTSITNFRAGDRSSLISHS